MADVLDYLVVGAGPAGLQLGRQLGGAGRSYLVLERGSVPAAFFTRFPRHRTLISVNKKYTGWTDPELNLRVDWNSLLDDGPDPLVFTDYSAEMFPPAEAFLRYTADYAAKHDLKIRYDTEVKRISRADEIFTVTAADGETFSARRLIMATGVTKPYVPDVPGMEFVDQYSDYDTDPERFINQRVLVLGKKLRFRDRRQHQRLRRGAARRRSAAGQARVAYALRRASPCVQRGRARHVPTQAAARDSRRRRS